MLINIYNETFIPVIGTQGPVFGYQVSEGVYSLLKLYPWLDIKRTTAAGAVEEKRKYFANKRNDTPKENFAVRDEIQILEVDTEPKQDGIDLDKEIDKLVEEYIETRTAKTETVVKKEEDIQPLDLSEEERASIVKYSNLQLRQMTKKQLKAILIERGHTNDEYTGRYHDTVDMLVQKVKATQ